jgi:uncharacterized protein YutE (UPF0331/DUF86 family)
VDWDVIQQKLESLRRCVIRLQDKCPADAADLFKDYDAQDIVSLNLPRAIQLCVDMGAHIVAGGTLPVPHTMGGTFDALHEAGIIDAELALRMKKAVGFRNLAIHNYDAIDWASSTAWRKLA